MELEEDAVWALDEKLRMIQERAAQKPEISVTFFRQDARKAGGAYVTVTGRIRKIDQYEKNLVMEDGTKISMKEVAELYIVNEGEPSSARV